MSVEVNCLPLALLAAHLLPYGLRHVRLNGSFR